VSIHHHTFVSRWGSALLDSYIHFKVVKGDDKALIWVFHFLKVFPRADPIYIYIYIYKAFEGAIYLPVDDNIIAGADPFFL
jgi:hypothetical protein